MVLCSHAQCENIVNAYVIHEKDIQITFSHYTNNIFRLNSFLLKLSKFKTVNTKHLRKQAFNLRCGTSSAAKGFKCQNQRKAIESNVICSTINYFTFLL